MQRGVVAGGDITDIAVNCVTDTFTVGGNVTGLTGNGLVLQNNGEDDLPISSNGSFTFSTAIEDGGAYDVSVLHQPDGLEEVCSVVNGTGIISGENVSHVGVTCVAGDLLFKDSFE